MIPAHLINKGENTDIIPYASKAAVLAQDLLFPRRCPFCDRPVRPFGLAVCPECDKGVQPLSPLYDALCCRCGRPLADPCGEYCGECLRREPPWLRGCAVYRYRDISGAVYRFKYEGRAEYAAFFGRKMAERFVREFDPAHVYALVPVPSSAQRLRKRGYNQAALLSRELGGALGVPVREDLLVRKEQTQALRSLTAAQRRTMLKNAFHVSGDVVESKVYVLVDDIYTTGATIDACSRELLRAGAGGIFFITLAAGEEPAPRNMTAGHDSSIQQPDMRTGYDRPI